MDWKRPMCWLFGCRFAYGGDCERCGDHIYEGGYTEPCLVFKWLREWRWKWRERLSWLIGKRCDHCGRRFWRGGIGWCCSKDCDSQWIPF